MKNKPTKIPYVFQRGNLFFFRWTLAAPIAQVLGKREIRRSLSTGYAAQARRRSFCLAAKLHALTIGFASMRDVTPQNLQALLDQYFIESLSDREAWRSSAPVFTEKDIDKELLAFQYLLKDTKDRLRRHDYAGLDPVIADLAKDWGVTVPASNSEIYKELCRGLLRTDARIFETELKRTDGDYSGDVLFSIPLAPVGLQSAKSYRLSEVVKFFVEEYTKAEAWTDRTVTDNNAIFRDLLEIVGDGIIGSLTRDSLLEFRRLVQKLPPRRTNDPRYRDLSIREIDQLDDVECIEPRTANKYFTRVSQFFNWAKDKGYVKDNLAENLHVKEKKKSKVSRDDFDKEDLRLIFFNDIFKSVRNGTNYRRLYMHWLPLIALFTGSRIEEIATLKTKDLYQVEGVWVFDINTDPDINPDGTPLFVPERPKDALEASKSTKTSKTKEKSVKTEASVRKIAIHPTLIELGILGIL